MKIRFSVVIGVAGFFAAAALQAASVPPPTAGQSQTVIVPAGQPITTAPADVKPRKVYDQEMLKKMVETLCAEGFEAYVGDQGKNVCRNWATPPDIAYTCVWDKKGPPAYPASTQGPCNLDYAVHRGDIIITRDQYKDGNPPLDFGKQVQCCYRAAAGP